MPKRNVAFIKPEEPSFLKKIKEQIGYREGPSIEDKREAIENYEDSDEEEKDDEKPQVVVIKDGDLTAEEAAQAFQEESERPADLTQKIVFKSKKSKDDKAEEKPKPVPKADKKMKKARRKEQQSKLSFNDEDEEEDN
ncbi:uncharacterized protein KIAA1143 homolog [Anopheles aquasalis]|uniref:uncharacterized protein KIAA1143 homolog n=1 Tax=Anopheles aquasalis TaxID=42839 RepID=UPI00215A22AD|nr:uncharacterized protein KIAA1143 homolog [Anopheles aquasalis]XP_050090940.1 uncharacterized protein KIAA1143 homolog [Anopheles aquasalis]